MKVVELDLLSWGSCVGGEHYNISIRCEEDKVDYLSFKMTKKQEKMFEEKDNAEGFLRARVYKAGDSSTRFWTEKEAVDAAIKYSLKTWKDVGLILVGDDLNPSEPVWCFSNKIKLALKKIWVQAEALYAQTNDPFSKFPKETKKMWKEWDELIQKVKNDL